LFERFLTTLLALALWLPAYARACPSDSGGACCCCCDDETDHEGTSADTAHDCCEGCDVASFSPATRPELVRWTLDIAVPPRPETSARLPESHHRLERPLARGPPSAGARLYIQNCSYLL
jgi:hypothetical protein